MDMSDDIRVVEIRPNGPIEKRPARYFAGNEWSFPIVYVLEDGREYDGRDYFRRMRDAKAAFADLPKNPTTLTTAIFHDGTFVGVCIHYGMVTAWPVRTLG